MRNSLNSNQWMSLVWNSYLMGTIRPPTDDNPNTSLSILHVLHISWYSVGITAFKPTIDLNPVKNIFSCQTTGHTCFVHWIMDIYETKICLVAMDSLSTQKWCMIWLSIFCVSKGNLSFSYFCLDNNSQKNITSQQFSYFKTNNIDMQLSYKLVII